MTAFDDMQDALFGDINLGVDAVYRNPPAAQPGVAVRLLFLNQADEEMNAGLSRGQKPVVKAELRASEVPLPAIGASLTIGARVLTLSSADRDRDRALHILTLREAP